MAAINVMGTNCMPELLRRLREKPSEVQIQWTQFLIKLGVMKPPGVAPWDPRRMQALTAILELNDPCFEPELTLMVKDRDAWIRRAGITAKYHLYMQPLRLEERIARAAVQEVARAKGDIGR